MPLRFLCLASLLLSPGVLAQNQPRPTRALNVNAADARNRPTGKTAPAADPALAEYGLFAQTAPRPGDTPPATTGLPLDLPKGARIAFIGNTLFDRAQDFGYFETLLHQRYAQHELVIRTFAWPADAIGLQPRPENFADLDQHLAWFKADVIFAAFGFNESFGGEEGLHHFHHQLMVWLTGLKAKAFNGASGPRIVLVSPIANENVTGVAAAERNNANLKTYTALMKQVAAEQSVGFVDAFSATEEAMASPRSDLTINGCHLRGEGYRLLAETLFEQTFGTKPPEVDEEVRAAVLEKDRQFFRRHRPLNTFYYTGDRNKDYGYLDFLPAMRNFDVLVANRDRRTWDLAQGKKVAARIDDSNVPPLEKTPEARGANPWLSPADEYKAFQIDPRFEVNLFASEEQFPEIACPIQMRWDTRGRLWVSCSTTYPHVYPGNEPNDKIVILEDTDADGRADKSTIFADGLHIPLSFEFGGGGVYVSEQPHLSFLQDTDGDGKADRHEKLLTGFGTEDSHHALHDFVWTPDGGLLFRESIFHHSQVETPYGPVRQRNSGWFRFEPRRHRLISFGTYPSTNPWGATFDDWGQHVASHPVYAQAFHALDPTYPDQHPSPKGLTAYSGTCGQEFVDFPFWPAELQGGFIKARYKPTNRIEILQWKEGEFGYDEKYVSDLIFSRDLCFIPVDIRFGPRGDLYVCDWYNPVKGHAQYSLRDERRLRTSGRIWRIVPKEAKLPEPPRIAGAPIPALLDLLKRPEYRHRYTARMELRERSAPEVKAALDGWVRQLDASDPRHRHHQMEAVWLYRNVEAVNAPLLAELLECDDAHARAAATHQLRYWHTHFPDGAARLRARANDSSGIVRMEAAIAASYLGTRAAFEALLETLKHPHQGHLSYAIRTALGSQTLKPHWSGNAELLAANAPLAALLKEYDKVQKIATDAKRTPADVQFDRQPNVKSVQITTVRERMLFDVTRIEVERGQPVRLEFINPDATAHNLVIVKPGAADEVGLAATEMAKDPAAVKEGQFVPKSDKVLFHTTMVAPNTGETLRFTAPQEAGEYPYVCTFPGHWVIMKGVLVVR